MCDAVVEHPTTRLEVGRRGGEVAAELGGAEVLYRPDRADRVEAPSGEVPVVEQEHVHRAVEPRLRVCSPRPFQLASRQRHPDRPHPLGRGGVADQPAPAGADVEQVLSGAQVELAADEVELRDLCRPAGCPRSGRQHTSTPSSGRARAHRSGSRRRKRWAIAAASRRLV